MDMSGIFRWRPLRFLQTASLIWIGLAPAPSYATAVAPTVCTNSLESGTMILGPAALPEIAIRIEMDVAGPQETLVAGPADIVSQYRRTNLRPPLVRFVQQQSAVIAPSDKDQSGKFAMVRARGDYPVPLPQDRDGRYVLLATKHHAGMTPSKQEQARDCLGEDYKLNIGQQFKMAVIAMRCDGSCGAYDMSRLLNAAYEQPRDMTFEIRGRQSYKMAFAGAQMPLPFAVTDPKVFDPARAAKSRTGDDGISFHPEVFKVTGTVRMMRPGILNYWESSPLLVRVDNIEPCPNGDTAIKCAPDETASRAKRVRGRDPSLSLHGQDYDLSKERTKRKAASWKPPCETDAECLEIYVSQHSGSVAVRSAIVIATVMILALAVALIWRRRRTVARKINKGG